MQNSFKIKKDTRASSVVNNPICMKVILALVCIDHVTGKNSGENVPS